MRSIEALWLSLILLDGRGDGESAIAALVSSMWSHAATMREEFGRRKWWWPDLTSQELGDVLVYLRSLPAARNAPVSTEINAESEGEAVSQSKGCAACHTAKPALTARLKGETLIDIGVGMRSHVPKVVSNPPRLEVGETRELLSCLWAARFFQDSGDRAAGGRVLQNKSVQPATTTQLPARRNCPKPNRPVSSSQMVSTRWHHGPQMQEQMKSKSVPWPRFSGTEMTDLIGFLNSNVKGKL